MSKMRLENFAFIPPDMVLPVGDYIVVDPCYIFADDPFWSAFVDYSFPVDEPARDEVMVEVDGKPFYIFSTAYGDGCFPVYEDGVPKGDASVDAGVLSIVPVEILTDEVLADVRRVSVRVSLENGCMPQRDEGDVTCGNIRIVTSGDDDEEGYIFGSRKEDYEEEF